MTDLQVRELRPGDEALWLALDDEPAAGEERLSETQRLARFTETFEEHSAQDARTFLIATEAGPGARSGGPRPAGRLSGVFVDERTYLITELKVAEGRPCSFVEDALVGYLASSFSIDGTRVFSSDRPKNAEIVSALERAGFETEKKKTYVGRSLEGELPAPGVDFELRTLAEVGRREFVRIMTEAAEGDPFEDMEGRDPDRDFQELVDLAGEKYDPASWYLAGVGGEVVGVLLPQAFPDSESDGTLFYVAVLPAFRGKGYGRALHATGLSILAERGLTKYIGSTDTRNAPMLRVFEANGCPKTATQLFYRPPAS